MQTVNLILLIHLSVHFVAMILVVKLVFMWAAARERLQGGDALSFGLRNKEQDSGESGRKVTHVVSRVEVVVRRITVLQCCCFGLNIGDLLIEFVNLC